MPRPAYNPLANADNLASLLEEVPRDELSGFLSGYESLAADLGAPVEHRVRAAGLAAGVRALLAGENPREAFLAFHGTPRDSRSRTDAG
jgi:hypothetical protein